MKSNVVRLVTEKGNESEFSRKTKPSKEMDKRIGEAIRLQRCARGKSQEWLAKELGMTFQNLQKKETGVNSVSIYQLLMLAKVLGFDANEFINRVSFINTSADQGFIPSDVSSSLLAVNGAHKLIGYYSKMSADDRRIFLGVARSMSRSDDELEVG